RAGRPPEPVSVGLLRLASWRASRSGVADGLVHPLEWTPAPAETVVRALVEHVRDALADSGDLALVEESLARLLARGGGADLQRAALARTGELRSVVEEAVERTAS
ncbi:carboxylate-amine ligase, partial [Streptomyces mobaraensis NBRC 13819 = DSM 40847]